MRIRLPGSIFITVTMLCLCLLSSVSCTESSISKPAVTISYSNISVCGGSKNIDRQVMTIQWSLENNNPEDVLLQWVEPNLSEALASRLLTEDARVNVGKVIVPGESIDVECVITFYSSGLTKEEIMEKCYIRDLTVSMESTVKFN